MSKDYGEARVGRDNVGEYFRFGKHGFEYVQWVALNDPSYLRWILGADFLDSVKKACRDALTWASQPDANWTAPIRADAAAEASAARLARDVDRIWKD